MSDLDFFVDLVITGTVLGLDHTSNLAEVEAVLGHDRTFPVGTHLLSSFGLVEFGWYREGPRKNWEVTFFGAQAHRLPGLTGKNQIEAALADRYGKFRPRLDFDELAAGVRARGFALEECPRPPMGHVEYWEPTSRMHVLAVSNPDEAGGPNPVGTVVKMLGQGHDASPALRFASRYASFVGYTTHLLGLSGHEREAWLHQREPADGQERVDWWKYLRFVVSRRTGGTPEKTRQWRRLGFALDRLAAERGVDSEAEAAARLALSVAPAGDLGLAEELPSVDEAVRRWLVAMSGTFTEAERLCAKRPLTPDEIRLSRRLRNQIHEVSLCLPQLASAALADELRAWTKLSAALLRLPV